MLRDPRNLGLTGFHRSDTGGDGPGFDLRRLEEAFDAEGIVLERTVTLEPGDRFLLVEGPGAASVAIDVDGHTLNASRGRFDIPPGCDGRVILSLHFEGRPLALTGLWAVS